MKKEEKPPYVRYSLGFFVKKAQLEREQGITKEVKKVGIPLKKIT